MMRKVKGQSREVALRWRKDEQSVVIRANIFKNGYAGRSASNFFFSSQQVHNFSYKSQHPSQRPLNTCIMSATESEPCLSGVAQEVSATNNDADIREPRETRDDEAASAVSGSPPGHRVVGIWQVVVQPGDDGTQPDHDCRSGSEAHSGVEAGVSARLGPVFGIVTMELGVMDEDSSEGYEDSSDGDDSSCRLECHPDSDCDSELELTLGLHEDMGLWLLRSDSTASARVVSELIDAGQQEHLRAYSAALIKLAEGDASVEEVLGDLVLRTMQREASEVNSGGRRRSSRRGSTDMTLWWRAVVALAVTSLARSAISGYYAITSPTSARTAQPADICSVQTQP